jgi:HK97 family phage prohead protease
MIYHRNIAMAVEKRLQDLSPTTYDEENRTVDAVLSRGSPVQRIYGTERLEISRRAVDLSRMTTSGISILDSHQQIGISNALGKLTRAWIENDSAGAALMGTIKFHETREGKKAEAMVSRGEIGGISIGYSVAPSDWRITDADGDEVDPNSARWNEDGLTFTATRFQLVECSLVSVPADADAGMRAANQLRCDRAYQMFSPELRNRVARMRTRQAIMMRSSSTLYVEPDHLPRASIFEAKQRPASSVWIKARMQARHNIAFGHPTYAA